MSPRHSDAFRRGRAPASLPAMVQIDPALFRPEAVSAETAAFVDRIEAALRDLPPTHAVPVKETRRARDEGRGLFPPGGPLEGSEWVETGGGWFRVSPTAGAPNGVYLHIHGGGWTLGDPEHHDRQNQRIAAETGATVVSVRYPLAPENPWPAGPDACLEAARWLIDGGAARFGAEGAPIVIGGESAGAHLAAVTALRLRDLGLGGRIAGLVLNYGMFDLRMTASMANWGDRQLVLSTPTVAWFLDNFTPDVRMRADPAASPLLAPLHGMPPALFQVGTLDPLMDDSLALAARWAGAGLEAELRVWPGGIHAFNVFDLEIARGFAEAESAFVRRAMS
jgi:acetyl esterase